MKTLAEIIANLKPSYSAVISSCNNITCSVERSGDGKILRFVRESKIGNKTYIEVFKTTKY